MKLKELRNQIEQKRSFLCVGLDVDLEKIPPHILKEEDPIFEFNKEIIDATHAYCVAFKPNLAFYEAYGLKGWKAFEKTVNYINQRFPKMFVIADAKRGDIGNTSTRYAKAFFEEMACDALTIAPYMGRDSVEPFLKFENKYAILLGLTSNEGSSDFQLQPTEDEKIYEKVLKTALSWKNTHNLMFVVGATQPQYFKRIREIAPHNFLLVPGIGAQGGDLEGLCDYGLNKDCGLLVNSSRGIIYASNNRDFGEKAAQKAKELQETMAKILKKKNFFS